MGRRGIAVLSRVTPRGQIRIGISGWTYPPWRGVFYPKGLAQKRELEYASHRFNSIEINGTSYGMQRPEAFASWAEQTPDDFIFAVKGPRFITHIRRVRDADIPLANFIASGLLRLGRKLGPVLWQFPPTFRFNPERIEAFLALLPLRSPGCHAPAVLCAGLRRQARVRGAYGRSSVRTRPRSSDLCRLARESRAAML